MKHILTGHNAWIFAGYGRNVLEIRNENDMEAACEAIAKTAGFFYDSMGLPRTLKDVGIGDDKFEIMAEHAASLLAKAFVPLTNEDVLSIFRACEKEEL